MQATPSCSKFAQTGTFSPFLFLTFRDSLSPEEKSSFVTLLVTLLPSYSASASFVLSRLCSVLAASGTYHSFFLLKMQVLRTDISLVKSLFETWTNRSILFEFLSELVDELEIVTVTFKQRENFKLFLRKESQLVLSLVRYTLLLQVCHLFSRLNF